ncbi:hypothetical protein RvY_05175 [Ramazzottius varieornatus]|uniref:Uncharacterized protein n=1 Tax=Ramazzottius varieornatus TaxID=947166 RepID=A0A1D1UZV0_RAMVA|nr:hypothetical protein RvY_05175 [Ramazzottius varieornatus]
MDRRAYVDLPPLFGTEDSWKKEMLPNQNAIIPANEVPEGNVDGDTGIETVRPEDNRLSDLGLQEIIESLPRDPRHQRNFRYL